MDTEIDLRLIERSRERLERLLAEDPEARKAAPSRAALEEIAASPTTIEAVEKAFRLYADRLCFGERTPASPYRMVRYSEVWERVQAFASGLHHERLADAGAFVGICGFGSVDWVVADLACIYLAAVSVPLQTGMSPSELAGIIRQTRLRCIVCSEKERAAIEVVLPGCPSVERLVVMERDMVSIERRGQKGGIVPKHLPSVRGEPDPVMTLYYTSGSTGTPKGAIYRERLVLAQWKGGYFAALDQVLPPFPQISVNYMPLNHGAGRGTVNRCLLAGGTTYFVAKSDMSTLFDDMELGRPTTMLLVPRVAAVIHQRFFAELARGDKSEDELLAEMGKTLLGDRLLMLITSTAPTPRAIRSFLERCFQVPVVDFFGSTEAGPLTMQHRVYAEQRMTWKLVDRPELGYSTTDKPFPRGELHVRSPFAIPGYYEDERATKQLFDEEGLINTGDIVEQRGDDTLVWVDRAKNVLKLAQGEFVATSKLEGIYASRSPFIRQIYIHGDSFHAYLVAVIVPELEAVRGAAPTDPEIKKVLRGELERVAREEGLRSHEIPRDFLIARTPFTTENGLLTASGKPSRPRLEARYGTRLEAIYAAIEREAVEQLYALRGPLANAPPNERVLRAMRVTLGLPDVEHDLADRSFIQLGGDSLSAASAATLIHDITGVHVPVSFMLNPTSSVGAVVSYVQRALEGGGGRDVTAADVHGAGVTSIKAGDFVIEKFLGKEELEPARAATKTLPPRAEVALLTGANGFLGRFLVLELLERLWGPKKKLYALVRAPNDEVARERLASTYESDPRLAKRFQALAGDLHVLAGDLIAPRFGLAPETYARLAREVDLIVHNGALVNHALGYEELFEPNVLGTARVMRLALDQRIKSISYVSTIGVLSPVSRAEPVREDEDLAALVPERPTTAGYAAGYGATKWGSELLLKDAHERLGLPVSVFRPSEIMAHSEYCGQVNVPDFFTRLLAGLVYTKLAPKTFYAPGTRERAKHFDGLSVESVARTIAAPSVNRDARGRFATYHVTSPHVTDGVTLDTIVDWVEAAGYDVDRIADYEEWFRRFHDRLASLDERERARSPFAILGAWSSDVGRQGAVDDALVLTRLRAIDPKLAELPHVDEALIRKTLDDMALAGIIERPRTTGPARRTRRRSARPRP
jgi:fatty acid CoA ligase FadD9